MAGARYTTTDPEVIKQWAEARNGRPALMREAVNGTTLSVLSIYLPDYHYQTSYDEISWDEFFKRFAEEDLVFLYQEKTARGDTSLFCRIVSPQVAIEATVEPAAEPSASYTSPSATTKLTQTDSLQTPLARGTETFRHPERSPDPSRTVLIGVVALIVLAMFVLLVSFWPERW
jgi:hypothetical protein